MIKYIIYTSLLFVIIQACKAQQSSVDSLRQAITTTQNDTFRLVLYGRLSNEFTEISPDSAYYYSAKMASLAKKLDYQLEEATALAQMGYALNNLGNYPRSLQTFLSALAIANNPESEKKIIPDGFPQTDEFNDRSVPAKLQRLARLARIHQDLGILYTNANNYEKALSHLLLSGQLAEQSGNLPLQSIINGSIGRAYLLLKKPDSALVAELKGYDKAVKANYRKYIGSIFLNVARAYTAKNNNQLAAEYFKRAIIASTEQKYFRGVVAGNLALADLLRQAGQTDSSLYYIEKALPVAKFLDAPELLLRSYTALANHYKAYNKNDSAVKYQSLIIKINDSLFSSKQAQQFQNIDFDEQQRQQTIEAEKAEYQNKFRTYALLAGIGIVLLVAMILWRNNLHRQRAYSLLIKQKQETDKQKSKAELALTELKAAQIQLIQQEKMASLGELTAGIAHEIQNPLNFVNNFSEVNKEMVDEAEEEINKGNIEEVKNILNDIKDNSEKINHHGKRADAIVKNMLQHSRQTKGIKEPTDINALCDEYLRLSYHGMRAKDKSFNAEIKTDFDNSIGKINIVPQDIGRVLLNLYNNAFYAVNEKKKTGDENYQPVVSVQTKKENNRVRITVSDNGNGIPQNIVDKIFQPFFTTKPTGEGTGLGLSLAYDIITKEHTGTLKVESEDGENSVFVIKLPTA